MEIALTRAISFFQFWDFFFLFVLTDQGKVGMQKYIYLYLYKTSLNYSN